MTNYISKIPLGKMPEGAIEIENGVLEVEIALKNKGICESVFIEI